MLQPDPKRLHAHFYQTRAGHEPVREWLKALASSELEFNTITRLQVEFSNSSLPYQIDLSILSQISSPELIDHITRVGVVFYERTAALAPGN